MASLALEKEWDSWAPVLSFESERHYSAPTNVLVAGISTGFPHKSSWLTALRRKSATPMAKTNSRDVSSISQLVGVAADRSHNAGQRPSAGRRME